MVIRVAPLALLGTPFIAKASTTAETVSYIQIVMNDLVGTMFAMTFSFVSANWQILIFFTFALVLIGGFWRKIKSWVGSLFRR